MVVVRPVICVTNKTKRHFVFIYGGWRVERENSWNSLQIFDNACIMKHNNPEEPEFSVRCGDNLRN